MDVDPLKSEVKGLFDIILLRLRGQRTQTRHHEADALRFIQNELHKRWNIIIFGQRRLHRREFGRKLPKLIPLFFEVLIEGLRFRDFLLFHRDRVLLLRQRGDVRSEFRRRIGREGVKIPSEITDDHEKGKVK